MSISFRRATLNADIDLQWIDYFCSFIENDMSWRIPLFIQVIIGAILATGSLLIPESPRYVARSRGPDPADLCMHRWLLDTDQDKEGMRVIADLYGEGDANNRHARREFREIKEAVLADVTGLLHSFGVPS